MVYLANTNLKDSQYWSMIRKLRLPTIVVINDHLVSIGSSLMSWWDAKVIPDLALIKREQDSISVTRRALFLRSVINIAVFVILKSWQEVDLVFMESP